VGQTRLPFIYQAVAPLPPFRILGTPKPKNFPFLFKRKKSGAQKSKKCGENFSVLGRKLLQSLRAEAGRRLNRKLFLKILFKKSSSFSIKVAQNSENASK